MQIWYLYPAHIYSTNGYVSIYSGIYIYVQFSASCSPEVKIFIFHSFTAAKIVHVQLFTVNIQLDTGNTRQGVIYTFTYVQYTARYKGQYGYTME